MPSCPTLPAACQLVDQLGVTPEEWCTPQRLPSLLDAFRTVPDPRAPHLVTHAWPMLPGLVACAMLCGVRAVRGPGLSGSWGALPRPSPLRVK